MKTQETKIDSRYHEEVAGEFEGSECLLVVNKYMQMSLNIAKEHIYDTLYIISLNKASISLLMKSSINNSPYYILSGNFYS